MFADALHVFFLDIMRGADIGVGELFPCDGCFDLIEIVIIGGSVVDGLK